MIETPQGSHHKYKFDSDLGVFRVNIILPAGMSFPYDFGFLPSTRGEDGDPLDVLVLMDAPASMGCVVACQVAGVIEARQREKNGRVVENSRLIAVPAETIRYADVQSITDLSSQLLNEIEQFFVQYTSLRGKQFRPRRRLGPKAAIALIQAARKKFENDD